LRPDVARFDLTTNAVMWAIVSVHEKLGCRVAELTHRSDLVTLTQVTKAVAGDV
jgi:hypothetical protein